MPSSSPPASIRTRWRRCSRCNHKKHVYCEKPLTHDVWEARKIREMAAKTDVITQMGIQMHATDNYHRLWS